MRVTVTLDLHKVPPDELLPRVIENLEAYVKALKYEYIGGDIVSRTKVPYSFVGRDTITAEVKDAS